MADVSASAVPAAAVGLQRWFRQEVENKIVGGPARLRVVVLLACILALDSADKATVGAVATELEKALHIGNAQVGVLVAVSTAIGALTTLPFGLLVDRLHRVRLVTVAILIWSAAVAVSGASSSWLMLLLTRLAMGAVVAAAAPTVASLTGDFFRPGERGRIYGYILAGELIGAGFGFLISGNAATIWSWRASFWILAGLGMMLAAALWWLLPEPIRGGQSHLPPGATEIPSDDAEYADPPAQTDTSGLDSDKQTAAQEDPVEKEVEEDRVNPHENLVLHDDPARMSLWNAARYVLSIRTNVTLIIASALGYFYFTGLRTFGVVFLRGHFDLGQSTGTTLLAILGIGAIVGVFVAGWTADRLLDRRNVTARILVTGAAFLIAAAFFLPALLAPSLAIAGPLFFLAAAGLGGSNPPLDAARLDIMHSRLWGRAESVRAALRYAFEALAPLAFGYVSTLFGGQGGFGGQAVGQGQAAATGLDETFLVMLVPLVLAGFIALRARRTYPRDVATAIVSESETRPDDGHAQGTH